MTKKTSVNRNTRSKKAISKLISKRKDSRRLVVKSLADLTNCDVVQCTWTKDETAQLMNLVLNKLKEVGSISFIQIQHLDWNQIHVDGKSTLECSYHFNQLIESRRERHVRVRDIILSYIDIGQNGTVKLKPASMLFCDNIRNKTILKNKNILKEASAEYRNLSVKEKGCYKLESKRRSRKYRQITRTIITTPFMLYQEYHQQKNGGELNKNKLKKKFESLENSEKLEWIRKAVNASKDSKDVNKILNKNELSIWRGEPKRPLQMRQLFIEMKRIEGMTYETASNAYRQLNEEDKDVYREMSRQAEIQYRIDLENFIRSLPEEEKGAYLTKLRALKQKETRKSISASVNSNDNVENIYEISENNTSNGVDSGDLVTFSGERSLNIDKEPVCTIEHILNFRDQKTSEEQSVTSSSRGVKDANVKKKPLHNSAFIDQSIKSTPSFKNPSSEVDYESQQCQGKNSNSQKQKPNTNILAECDSTTIEQSSQSTSNTKTMHVSKRTTIEQLSRSTPVPGYGNLKTPGSQLISSEQPDESSIHSEPHQKTPSNLQKRKPNTETTSVCKRTIIKHLNHSTPGFGNKKTPGSQLINSEQADGSSTDKRLNRKIPFYFVRKSTTIEQSDESSTDKTLNRKIPWYFVPKSTTIEQSSRFTPGYKNQTTPRAQLMNSKQAADKRPQQKTPWYSVSKSTTIKQTSRVRLINSEQADERLQKRKSNARKTPVCKRNITRQSIRSTPGYGNEKYPGFHFINSEQTDHKRPQQKTPWYSVCKRTIIKQLSQSTRNTSRVQLSNSEQQDKSSTIKIPRRETTWKNKNLQKRKSNAKTPVCKSTTIEQSSRFTPGYKHQKTPKTHLINSERTDNSSSDSDNESQQKTRQKNIYLQKQRLNTEMEAVCISTTVEQLTHHTPAITPKLLGAQLIKPRPKKESSSDSDSNNKSQLQIPKQEPDVISKQLGCRSHNTLGTQVIISQPSDESSSGGDDKSELQIQLCHLMKHEPDINTIVSKQPECRNQHAFGVQLIKSKPKEESSSDSDNNNKSQLQIPKQEPDVTSKRSGCRSQNTFGTQVVKSQPNDESSIGGDDKSELQIQLSHLMKHEPDINTIVSKQPECRNQDTRAQLLKEEPNYESSDEYERDNKSQLQIHLPCIGRQHTY